MTSIESSIRLFCERQFYNSISVRVHVWIQWNMAREFELHASRPNPWNQINAWGGMASIIKIFIIYILFFGYYRALLFIQSNHWNLCSVFSYAIIAMSLKTFAVGCHQENFYVFSLVYFLVEIVHFDNDCFNRSFCNQHASYRQARSTILDYVEIGSYGKVLSFLF